MDRKRFDIKVVNMTLNFDPATLKSIGSSTFQDHSTFEVSGPMTHGLSNYWSETVFCSLPYRRKQEIEIGSVRLSGRTSNGR
jgi:hypothetical protein